MRTRLAAAAIAVGLTAAGCTSFGLGEPTQEGPAASWTLPTAGDLYAAGTTFVHSGDQLSGISPSGRTLWSRPKTTDGRIWIVGALVVTQRSKSDVVEVIEAATGRTRWRIDAPTADWVAVSQTAVYEYKCGDTCTTTARDVNDGRPLWTIQGAKIQEDRIGTREPYAPTVGPYLLMVSGTEYFLVDGRTGRRLARSLPPNEAAWYQIPVANTVVYTDNDPESSDRRCTVALKALDGTTGATKWSGNVFSGTKADDTCEKALNGGYHSGWLIISDGTRIAALTDSGRPQLFDLATGKTVWSGARPGVPIDMDAHSMLVRAQFDTGNLALLDTATGRQRWTAPDPGLEGTSASWQTRVTGGLVAVSASQQKSGYKAAAVVVYDAKTGRELLRRDGWLAGAGDNWVAITHSDKKDVSRTVTDFIRV
ncbi:PQQ-binding-like beta-propeller repeat protein [Fodinicola acaciae]|uniref:outer membrane protein assembly factor BamB family protein n=1 Tax=Fodinicola acaciae TaxID=2681555 RepID=UPI0013D4987A|nr:PQQ-binding-like beta-propeller repeat protein [Fodinicola acaciae]